MMKYLKENIICSKILQNVYKVHESKTKKMEKGTEACHYENMIKLDEARKLTLCPRKTNSTGEVSQMQGKSYPHDSNTSTDTDKQRRASFEGNSEIYLQLSDKNPKSGSRFSVNSLSATSLDNEFDMSRPSLKRRSRSVSRFDKNENTKSLNSKLTVGSSSGGINFPRYRNAKCQTLALINNEQHKSQLEKQNETPTATAFASVQD